MATNLLVKEGLISNDMQCLNILQGFCKVLPIVNFINSYSEKIENTISYIDISGNDTTEDKAHYKWVNSGYRNLNDEIVYFSFHKSYTGDWLGAIVGTEDTLTDRLVEYKNNNVTDSKQDNKADVPAVRPGMLTLVYEDLFNRLLIKERWDQDEKKLLANYVGNLRLRVENQLKKKINNSDDDKKKHGFIVNNDNTKIILNTGLIDRFRSDIYMMFNIRTTLLGPTVVGPSVIINNRQDVLDNGFQLPLPEPFRFYETIDELLFSADIEDFDLSDMDRLNHIINERRFRFPEQYRDINEDVIAQKLKTAIETAVKLSKRDYKYVIPMYNIHSDSIQYLMPLHLDMPIDGKPELVLVVGKTSQYNLCSIKTILLPEEAYLNARLIARPESTWL